jgi:hypothetical protein
VVEKLRAAWVKQAPSGSFDSAPSSAVSRDKSVPRSAQDDEFVGVLTKNIPKQVSVYGMKSWVLLDRTQSLATASNLITQTLLAAQFVQ